YPLADAPSRSSYASPPTEHRLARAGGGCGARDNTESDRAITGETAMSLRLEGKNALITGGASGIGRATALRFAEEGANIGVADRHLAAAEETAAMVRALGRRAFAHQVDTSVEKEVAGLVDRCVGELGGIDVLVAAAGISHARYGEEGTPAMGPLSEKPLADWKKVLSVNLDGVFITDREVARAM